MIRCFLCHTPVSLDRTTIECRACGARFVSAGYDPERLRAEAALESIIANTEIKAADALAVKRGHRALDHELARRTMRPALSSVADSQDCEIVAMSDAQHRCDNGFIAHQRRNDDIALRQSAPDQVAIESAVAIVIEDELESEFAHARLLLRVHDVDDIQSFVDRADHVKRSAWSAAEDTPGA